MGGKGCTCSGWGGVEWGVAVLSKGEVWISMMAARGPY